MYSMKDLSSRVKRTPQALYSLIKQNESLSSIVKENTEKNGRFIKYGEPVLSWLLDYYKITEPTADEVGEGIVEPEAQEIPQHSPLAATGADLRLELALLRQENQALKEAIEALKNDLEIERKNNQDLLQQNGLALLALKAEQDEKQKYLPAPRKTIGQFVKGLFSKEK